MSFKSVLLAAMTLLATSCAHMEMKSPVPYSIDKLDNGPITKAQFPCKIQNGFTVSQMNSMKVGEEQTLQFSGSAVHGGGSCQLAITTDTEPTASSKFKVIKSIEGGCPGVNGAETFKFTLPPSIPNGKASFAWTWFAKLSGRPEMYMNCAPIEVTGGASDDSEFQKLPDMFVANIDDTCNTPTSKSVQFPNPGSEVQNMGTNDLAPPTGSACGASGPSPPAQGSGSPKPPSGPSSAPASGPSATEPAAKPSTGAAAPTNPGGVFAPGASSTSTLTTLATVTAPAPGTGAPAVPTGAPAGPTGSAPAAPTGGAPSSGTPPSGSPSTGGGSSCSQNGAIVCNGPTQFGLCNNGNVVFMPVAAGTTCVNGAIQKRGYNGRIARPRAVAY